MRFAIGPTIIGVATWRQLPLLAFLYILELLLTNDSNNQNFANGLWSCFLLNLSLATLLPTVTFILFYSALYILIYNALYVPVPIHPLIHIIPTAPIPTRRAPAVYAPTSSSFWDGDCAPHQFCFLTSRLYKFLFQYPGSLALKQFRDLYLTNKGPKVKVG